MEKHIFSVRFFPLFFPVSNVQPFVVKAASVLFGDVAFDSNHYWFIHTERDSAAVAKVAAESLPLRIHSKFFIGEHRRVGQTSLIQ